MTGPLTRLTHNNVYCSVIMNERMNSYNQRFTNVQHQIFPLLYPKLL